MAKKTINATLQITIRKIKPKFSVSQKVPEESNESCLEQRNMHSERDSV